ncbi:MAG: AsmA family protein [Arenicellales bacterium]|nr:AsmA family protein [Arenicellales bacterium]MDP7490617.1 AsmA family protein [Arenicellales bacterium]
MKLLKRLILSAVSALLVLLLVAVLALQYLDWNRYRTSLAHWATTALGRSVAIENHLAFQLWPVMRLQLGGLRLGSPDGFAADLLKAEMITVEIEPLALLSGTVVVNHLALKRPVLHLETDSEGRSNWHFRQWEQRPVYARPLPPIVVRETVLAEGQILYQPRNRRYRHALSLSQMTFTLPEGVSDGRLDVIGALNDSDLVLKGSLRAVTDSDVKAVLDFQLGSVAGTVDGVVREVMSGGNADMQLHLETVDLRTVAKLVVPHLSSRMATLLAGKANLTGRIRGRPERDLRVEAVDVEMQSPLIRLTASGSVSLVRPTRRATRSAAQFQVLVETDRLSEVVNLYRGRLPFDGEAQATGMLTGRLGNYRIDGIELKAHSGLAELAATGSLERLGSPGGPWLDLAATARSVTVDQLAAAYGLNLPVPGNATATGQVTGSRGDYRLDDLALVIDTADARLTASGSIQPLGRQARYDLPFSASTADLAALTARFGLELPLQAQVTASGKLSGTRGQLQLADLAVNAASAQANLELTGEIGPLGEEVELGLVAKARVSDLAALGPVLGLPLDILHDISAEGTARVFGSIDEIGLDVNRGRLNGGGVSGRFTASLPSIGQVRRSSFSLDAKIDNIARFASWLHTNPDYHGHAGISLSLVGEPSGKLPFEVRAKAQSEAFSLLLNGQLDGLAKGAGFDFHGDFERVDTAQLSKLLGQKLPDMSEVAISAALHRPPGPNQLLSGEIEARSGGLQAVLAATFAWPPHPGTEVNARLSADSLTSLSALLPVEFADVGPLQLNGTLSGQDDSWELSHFDLTIADKDSEHYSELSGSASCIAPTWTGCILLAGPAERPSWRGDLTAERLDFAAIFPAPPEDQAAGTARLLPGDRIFSDVPLPLGWVEQINLDVQLKAEQLITRKLEAGRLSASVKTLDGVLTIEADSGQLSGGTFNTAITVDTTAERPEAEFDFNIAGLKVEELPELRGKDLPIRGQVTVGIELSGKGISPHEMLASANGSAYLSANKAYMPASNMDIFTRSILIQTLNIINRINIIKSFSEKREYYDLECGLIGFRILDGEALSHDSIAFVTREVTYLVRGGFRFDDESILFAVKPKARRGLGLSFATLTNFRGVGGTLSQPKPVPDPETLFMTGLTWAAAVAITPWAILAKGLFDLGKANEEVCVQARENYQQFLEENVDMIKGELIQKKIEAESGSARD